MVVDQIHVHHLAIDEAEDDPPVSGYAYAPLATQVASQRMQPVAGSVHVPWFTRRLKRVQHTPDAFDMVGIQAPGVVSFVESP